MWAVFKKEFLELIRDKKTLFLTIALPFLMLPLMYGGMAFVGMQASEKANSDIQYVMFNEDLAPSLQKRLLELDNFVSVGGFTLEQVENEILHGTLDIAIALSYEQVLNEQSQVRATLYYDASKTFSDATRIVQKQIEALNDQYVLDTLVGFGQSPEQAKQTTQAIIVESQTVTEERAIAGSLIGGLVSFLIIISMLSTAIALASDLGAGEKERFTLEPLLITPQSRFAIAFGKWLTLTVYALINAALTVMSIGVTALVITNIVDLPEIKQLLGSIPPLSLLLAWLMLAPVAGLISAIMLATSTFASSFKEAQSLGSIVLMAFMMPSILTIQGVMELEGYIAWTPVINVSLSIIDILKGDFALGYLLPVLLSNGLALGLALLLTLSMYKRESVLFRG